jgi:hypothetical protein
MEEARFIKIVGNGLTNCRAQLRPTEDMLELFGDLREFGNTGLTLI